MLNKEVGFNGNGLDLSLDDLLWAYQGLWMGNDIEFLSTEGGCQGCGPGCAGAVVVSIVLVEGKKGIQEDFWGYIVHYLGWYIGVFTYSSFVQTASASDEMLLAFWLHSTEET